MRQQWLTVVILCSIPVLVVFLVKSNEINGSVWIEEHFGTQINCSTFLETIDPPFQAFLIDLNVLQNLEENRCQAKHKIIRLAIDVGLSSSIRRENYNEYDIIHYEKPPNKDYLRVYDSDTRIIPRTAFTVVGNLYIPRDIKRFLETWKRSKFVDCLGLRMNRTSNNSYLPVDRTIQTMSSLMNYLISFDVYPFLNGGTLLGWYRECNIIPHTMDADFAAPIEQYKPELLKDLRGGKKFFLKRRLGLPNDTFEFTIRPLDGGRPMIDLFWMYSSQNESWVGGTAGDGSKYKYTYPRHNETCAGDLLGHIFWIPCNPRKVMEGRVLLPCRLYFRSERLIANMDYEYGMSSFPPPFSGLNLSRWQHSSDPTALFRATIKNECILKLIPTE